MHSFRENGFHVYRRTQEQSIFPSCAVFSDWTEQILTIAENFYSDRPRLRRTSDFLFFYYTV